MVFGSSPNLAATMWTGTPAVNASVAAVWRSVWSVPAAIPAALRCRPKHRVSPTGGLGRRACRRKQGRRRGRRPRRASARAAVSPGGRAAQRRFRASRRRTPSLAAGRSSAPHDLEPALLRHRLVRQPDGFEGITPTAGLDEPVLPSDLAPGRGLHDRSHPVQGGLCAAASPTADEVGAMATHSARSTTSRIV